LDSILALQNLELIESITSHKELKTG